MVTYVVVSFFPLMFFSMLTFKDIEKFNLEEASKYLEDKVEFLIKNKNYESYQDLENDIDANFILVNTNSQLISYNLNDETQYIKNAAVNEEKVYTDINGEPFVLATTTFKDDILVVYVPAKAIYDKLYDIEKNLYLLSIVNSFLVGILSFIVSGIIVKPLKKILKVIEKMSAGHLEQRIPINSRDEIGELSFAFNQMSDRLQQVDSIRQEFVSNVSHELKTPVSSIKVLSESLLLQDNVPEEMYKEFLRDITSEVDRLNEIIEDLLMLVRLDRKEVAVEFENVDINKLIGDIVKRLRPIANLKNIEIEYDEIKDVLADVDDVKFSLAITNLIENAIKYNDKTENGYVKVKLDSDHQNVYIAVEDNGIGIPESDHSKIFERFYRVDKVRDRQTGGTGLGLSITYKTILLHQGHIKVSSKIGEGSTFLIRIPLKNAN